MKIDTEHLKQLRAERTWSQEKLSEASGLSLRTVQRVEAGGSASIESVRALAAALQVEPADLILMKEEVRETKTPLDAVREGLRRFADFSGTATRYEFWWFFVFIVIVLAVAAVIGERVLQIASILLLIPLFSAGTRRLREAGISPWWQLFWFVPFGQIVIMIQLAMPPGEKTADTEAGRGDMAAVKRQS